MQPSTQDALKVADIRAALAFKGVTHDAKALRPTLRLLLAQTAGLPSGGEVPPLVLPAAEVSGAGSAPASAQTVDDAVPEGGDASSGSDSDDEDL